MPVSFHPYLEDSRKTEVHFCQYIVLLITDKSLSISQAFCWHRVQETSMSYFLKLKLMQVGYCRAEFHSKPPKESSYGLTNRLQVDTNKRIAFYECRGKPTIISAAFVSKEPWLMPIDIQSLSINDIT